VVSVFARSLLTAAPARIAEVVHLW
jgi:hypothetical protein